MTEENKMEAVAQLFGKKLGEEFKVGEVECRKNLICKITEKACSFITLLTKRGGRIAGCYLN